MGTVTTFVTANFTPSLLGAVSRNATNESFTTIRAGAGTAHSINPYGEISLLAGNTTNNFNTLERTIMLFDTSSIPVASIILSATINLLWADSFVGLGTNSIEIVSSNPASNNSLVNADYGTLGNISFASVSQSSVSAGGVASLSLNASGIASVTPNAVTKLGAIWGWDLNNSFTGTWASGQINTVDWDVTDNGAILFTVYYSFTSPTLAITGIGSTISNINTITTS